MIVQNQQQLQALQANLPNMTDDELRDVQIHIEGRLVFPCLDAPRAGKANPNGRKTYSGVLIFPMGQLSAINMAGMNAIALITNRFKQMYHSQVPERAYVRCYKNIQESPTQDSGNPHPEFYQNSHWVNTSTGEKFKPQIYKKINGAISEVQANDPDIYFGQNVVFIVTLYPTGTDPKRPELKKGTNANLIGVLILGGGEKIQTGSGQTQIDPNASFSAFASMTTDFSSGSTNPFAGQANQGQQNSNGFGGGQKETYTPPPSNDSFGGFGGGNSNNVGNASNGMNHAGQSAGAAHSSNPFNNGNFGGNNNNGNNGGNFGGGLI